MESWLTEYLSDPARLKTGKAITPLFWLPPTLRTEALKIIEGEHPYSGIGFSCEMRNISPVTIEITTDVQWIPTLVRSGDGYVEGSTGRGAPVIRHLAPGDTVRVRARFALLALEQYNRSAWSPDIWDESTAIPQSEALEEVSYRTDFAESPTAPPEKKR
jgi:hypothetical protein